ncbi:MAG: sodium:proton antiporter [Legionellales bacterium]|nr:sodium:proton antiporter [Legionellales bacterium]
MIEGLEPSWLALLPPLVAIILAFLTQQVLLALSTSILVGGIVLAVETHSFHGMNVFEHFMIPALWTKSFASILLIYLGCLGTIIGMWNKTGGAQYFAEWLGRKIVSGPRSALVFSWVVGLIFHQGGTISTVLAGTTLKPVNDRYRVSHEELSYVVDSTASPIATIIPFNAWPMYVSGVCAGLIPIMPTTDAAYRFFLWSIPFNFYGIVAVTMTLLFSLGWLPWVGSRMKAAIYRSRTTGQLDHPDASPLMIQDRNTVHLARGYKPSIWDFIVPIGLLLSITIIPFTLWEMGFLPSSYSNMIAEAFVVAMASSLLMAKFKGMPLKDMVEGVWRGCHSMLLGAVIIGLAVTVGTVTKKLGAAEYTIQLLEQGMPMWLLPACLTLLCMVVAFATGTSLGTYAVVYPVALPLAYALNPDPFYIQVCFGAVLGGTVFGDQCSPISDTTILSSMFTGCDLMHHVRSQMPLALVAAFLACALSTGLLWITY